MGANHQLAFQVAQKVENRVYEGMPTWKVLQLIFKFMRKNKPGVGYLFDLRKGLSVMSSKPEFEVYVQTLLSHQGFEIVPNRILKGRCVEHEVDAIATKNGVTYFVEAKHHLSYHSLTGLDDSRIARAVLEDISEGYQLGMTNSKIDKAMIITNTRYSEHAIKYGQCRGIVQIGWNYPANEGLENIIERGKLHPLSCLKGLRNEDRLKLLNSGLILIRQLQAEDQTELTRKTGLKLDLIREIMEKIHTVVNTLEY